VVRIRVVNHDDADSGIQGFIPYWTLLSSGTINNLVRMLVGFSIPEAGSAGRNELALEEERLHLGPTRSGSLKSLELYKPYVNPPEAYCQQYM
jgi:hypothetical protein